jgi:D-alanine--poly(phosphoribitol) ligase subunit 1
VAETTDLSFDLSVNNMFTCWNAGASLHVLSAIDLMAPNKFIVAHSISVWLSVPSIIALMKRVKALRPGTLPSLRYSFFCGEPFPVSSALAWQEAACNSVVDNLYGPTEATVWCVGQRLTDPPLATPKREVLAIGAPIAGMEASVVDANMNFLPAGEQGELALAGPQLATGYFRAPELTAKRFPTIGGKRWYLTGDLAFQDEAGLFHHLGRIDNQIKVLGNRVELEDIEFHLRAVCQTELVAVVPWPVSNGSADGVVGFIVGRHMEASEIKAGLQSRLPAYMVPTAIHTLDALPFNANGKLDRKALTAHMAGA